MKFTLIATAVTLMVANTNAHLNCIANVIMKNRKLVKRAEGVKFAYSGASNPETWFTLPNSGQCQIGVGKKQSPIDFVGDELLKTAQNGAEEIPQIDWKAPFQNVEFENNGRTVEVVMANQQNRPTLVFPSDPQNIFELEQFHQHDPSEHTFDQKGLPMETHFVFQSAKNDIAVFAVMWNFANQTSEVNLLPQLMNNIPTTGGQKNTIATLDLSVMNAVSNANSADGFFRYEGSLTTPPCTEGLKWTVAKKPLDITVGELSAFWGAMVRNNRYTQATNGRGNDVVVEQEQSQTGPEQTQTGAEQTQTGAEQTQTGAEQTQTGAVQTQTGAEQNQNQAEQQPAVTCTKEAAATTV